MIFLILGLCACPPPKAPKSTFTVTANPAPVDFGNVVVDTTVTIDVKVTTQAGTSISVSISGAGFTETDNCTTPIFGVCHVQVSATPTALGPLTGVLNVVATQGTMQASGGANLNAFGVQSGSALRITTTNLADGVVDAQYQQTIQTAGGTPPVRFSIISGNLPTGLTLDPSGIIVGTPTFAGTFSFTVQARDSSSPTQSASESFSITINPVGGPVSITTKSLPGGVAGTPYTATVQATGGKLPYTFNIIGVLPGGLIMDNQGHITGTPSGPAGTASFTVTVKDSNSPPQTASQPLSITITTLAILPTSLPDGFIGSLYTQTLFPINGTGPFTWTESGPLPDGLTLTQTQDGSTATISGTPTKAATFTFSITLTDANGSTAGQTYTVTMTSSGSNNDNLMNGPYEWQFAVATPQGIKTEVFTGNFDAAGNITGCTISENSAAGIINQQPCAAGASYNVNAGKYTQVFVTPPGALGQSQFAGTLDAAGNLKATLVSAPAGNSLGGSGLVLKRNPDLIAGGLATLQGNWAGGFLGEANGAPATMLTTAAFDASGNGSNVFMAMSFLGGTETSTGFINLSGYNQTTGCFTVNAQVNLLTSPPAPDISLLINGVGCLRDANSWVFVSTDQRNATNAIFSGNFVRAASGLTNNSAFSGPALGQLSIQAATGVPFGQQMFLLNFDGKGNVGSGLMDQSHNGTPASGISLGGVYAFDGVNNGFGTIDLTATGGTPLNSHFTFVASGPNAAFIMAGNPSNASSNLGVSVLTPQTAPPCSFDASFQFGINTFNFANPPAGGPAGDGAINFGDGANNQFFGLVDAVQNGAVTLNEPFTGVIKTLDPSTCHFSGTLNGFSGVTVPVTGFLAAPASFIVGAGDSLVIDLNGYFAP